MTEEYSHSKHFNTVKSWLQAKHIEVPDKRLFSDIGFMVDNAAVGFLFLNNSCQAYIDHVAGNPLIDAEDRDNALVSLIYKLEQTAKEEGVIMVTVLASLPAMKERFDKIGYIKHGEYSLYYKVLK